MATSNIKKQDRDPISNLPAAVIEEILSRMPIRDAARTSVLSKKWRYKFVAVPHLVFDDRCVFSSSSSKDQTLITNKFVNIVDHVLLLHNGSLNKFKLTYPYLEGVSDIDRWLLYLSKKSIKEFILEVGKGRRYKLPTSLFSWESLIHLELLNCLLKHPSSFKGFKNLKSLHLQHVTMSETVFESFISSCPSLERLTLKNFDGLSHLYMDAPNLEFVDIVGVFSDVRFNNTIRLAFVSIDNEQTLSPGSSCELLMFFVHLYHIRRLTIGGNFFKYLSIGDVPNRLPRRYDDLSYLSIKVNLDDLNECLAVLCLLRSSPNLQELNILVRSEKTSVSSTTVDLWNLDDDWNFMLVKLRLVKIESTSGMRSELDFIKFLLSCSPVLEKMTVSVDGNLNLAKELLRFRRVSTAAEIIYSD